MTFGLLSLAKLEQTSSRAKKNARIGFKLFVQLLLYFFRLRVTQCGLQRLYQKDALDRCGRTKATTQAMDMKFAYKHVYLLFN